MNSGQGENLTLPVSRYCSHEKVITTRIEHRTGRWKRDVEEGEHLKITVFDALVEKRARDNTNGKEKAYAVDRAACDQQA